MFFLSELFYKNINDSPHLWDQKILYSQLLNRILKPLKDYPYFM